MNTFLKSFRLLCLFVGLATFVQAQNVGNWNSNTSGTPNNVGIGTTTPANPLHVKVNTHNDLARFEQGASNSKDGGIYIKGAINGCSSCDASYITLANYYQNANSTYAMARVSGGIDAGYSKKSHLKFKVNDGNNLVEAMRINYQGKVRVGDVSIASDDYKLFVEKGILTERIKVAIETSSDWSDYVFAPNYQRNSLDDIAQFIAKNKHLPNVPSAKEVVANGIDIAQMDATLLRQIEELWLHMIDMKKENEALKQQVKLLMEQK